MVTSKHKTCLVQSRYGHKTSIRYEVTRYWPFNRPINKFLRLGLCDSSLKLTCHGQSVERIGLALEMLHGSTQNGLIKPPTRPHWPASINPYHNRVQKITKMSDVRKNNWFLPFSLLKPWFQIFSATIFPRNTYNSLISIFCLQFVAFHDFTKRMASCRRRKVFKI